MQDDFLLESYDYLLPEKNIAQYPSTKRDGSRLLILSRDTGEVEHTRFSSIPALFQKGDILVVNDTKVFPARLHGRKETGGKVEIFLLGFPRPNESLTTEQTQVAETNALLKCSKRPPLHSPLKVSGQLTCSISEYLAGGQVRIRLHYPASFDIVDILQDDGSVPLPPYIERESGTTEIDQQRYQTVYAQNTGAVAAPTAGLHFTDDILRQVRNKGVEIANLTLHVGYGTFAPVRVDSIEDHEIHSEYVEISAESAQKINDVKNKGGKVWAVGTTTVRALEFHSSSDGELIASKGWCDLYITPGYSFSIVDNLVTNFHLPKSSLLFLVSALCGREQLLSCYSEAIERDYRFYSYGDAMAIIS